MNKKLIISHRGFLNLSNKSNIIEFDLRKTKDNVYIISHDPKIKGKIIQDTIYKELIPPPIKVKDILSTKIKFNIDLKEKGYEKDLIKFILKYLNKKDLIISSEKIEILKKIHQIDSKIKLGLIFPIKSYFIYTLKKIFLRTNLKILLDKVTKNKFDYLIPNKIFINKRFLKETKKKKIKVLPWCINTKSQIIKFLNNPRLEGIITDNPKLANSLLKP